MSSYTQNFADLKTALQTSMTYSPDLTAAVAVVQAAMGADWSGLTGDAWADAFLPLFFTYCFETAGSQFWGIETDQNTIRISKRENVFVTFEILSVSSVQARLLSLTLAGWSYHS